MKFSEELSSGSHVIRAYGDDFIQVNQQTLNRHFIIHAGGLIEDWGPTTASQLEVTHFDPILALQPEVVILGTGSQQLFPDIEIRAIFLSQGIGFEAMDTGAACRTYNILMSENRNVVAALMLSAET